MISLPILFTRGHPMLSFKSMMGTKIWEHNWFLDPHLTTYLLDVVVCCTPKCDWGYILQIAWGLAFRHPNSLFFWMDQSLPIIWIVEVSNLSHHPSTCSYSYQMMKAYFKVIASVKIKPSLKHVIKSLSAMHWYWAHEEMSSSSFVF